MRQDKQPSAVEPGGIDADLGQVRQQPLQAEVMLA
jgi:hypothetical protein